MRPDYEPCDDHDAGDCPWDCHDDWRACTCEWRTITYARTAYGWDPPEQVRVDHTTCDYHGRYEP